MQRVTKRDEFRPGDVMWLPSDATWLNRGKSRPFALANRCSPSRRGTLVFGSTQATEKAAGAACAEVMPVPQGINKNGLPAPTCFYPGVLVPVEYDDLPAHSGILGRSMETLREATRRALGIGTGSCLDPDAPVGSRRGRIMVVERDLAAVLRTRYVAALTEHHYSRQRRYDVVVPLIPGDRVTADPSVLVREGREWLSAFDPPIGRVLVPVQVVQSTWYADDIVRETRHALDNETLEEIDRRLCALFGL